MSGCPRRAEARFRRERTGLAELNERLALRRLAQATCGGYGHLDDHDGGPALGQRHRWKLARRLRTPGRKQKSQHVANQEARRLIQRFRTNLRSPKIPWRPNAELPALATLRLQREAHRQAGKRLLRLSFSSRHGESVARKLRTTSRRHPADSLFQDGARVRRRPWRHAFFEKDCRAGRQDLYFPLRGGCEL